MSVGPGADWCTRRSLMGAALACAGAALLFAGEPGDAAAAPLDDETILRVNLQVEQIVALAYELALAGGRLDRRNRATATEILGHERAHAQALTVYLRELGGRPPAPPSGIAAVEAVSSGFGLARSQRDVLGALAELERLSVYGYYLGIQRLYDQKLVETVTAILGAEAQHLTVLRAATGSDPLPTPLEVGAPPAVR